MRIVVYYCVCADVYACRYVSVCRCIGKVCVATHAFTSVNLCLCGGGSVSICMGGFMHMCKCAGAYQCVFEHV